MWIKTFYWLRLFTSTSFYIKLISETLNDIKYFLICFIFILMTFGNFLLIMNHNEPDDEQLYEKGFGPKVLDTILNQYMLALGEYYVEKYDSATIWIMFIASTFIT